MSPIIKKDLLKLGWCEETYDILYNDSINKDSVYYIHQDSFDGKLIMECVPNDPYCDHGHYHENFDSVQQIKEFFGLNT